MRLIIITFIKFKAWFYNNITYAVKNYYYKHKKAHYLCCICGDIIAPYFEENKKHCVITDDYGWYKLRNGKWRRWICCHCIDYEFAWSDDPAKLPNKKYKKEEWEKIVKKNRKTIIDIIKEKDFKYYNYWLVYGYHEDN